MKLTKTLLLTVLGATSVAAKYDSAPAIGKGGFLRSFNQIEQDHDGDYMTSIWNPYCAKICCDYTTEETCYDENYNPTSCAPIANGGCPCPDGQAKCGAFEGYAGVCTTLCCDYNTEEACYDENYNPTSCAPIADGGCPCPEGHAKCGGWEGYAGFCTTLCCDSATEETCYDDNYEPSSCAPLADGGCPCADGQVKCDAMPEYGYPGYCTSVCCDSSTEETCYDDFFNPVSCAAYTDGSCPCPEGQARCGADPESGYIGYCMSGVCCDYNTEETCYDDSFNPVSCAAYTDGGCPCPEGQDKCGAMPEYNYPGYCTSLCCDYTTEETCYDGNYEPSSCALIADGGCPCPEGEERCAVADYQLPHEVSSHDDVDDEFMSELVVEAQGMPKEVAYFRHLKMIHQKLSTVGGTTSIDSAKHALEQKMMAVVRIIERREGKDTQQVHVAKFVESRGTTKEIAYFYNLKREQQRLSADEGNQVKSVNMALERKELELLRAIKLRDSLQQGNPFAKNEISFM